MSWHKSISETIGNTPLLKLNHVTNGLKAIILAKLEFLNPGGSLKDRAASYMLRDAEKSGKLKPGGTVVEATAGNTGIGLATYATLNGYKSVTVCHDRVSQEKRTVLRALGARLIICPSDAPPGSSQSSYEVAKRVADTTPDAYFVDQRNNLSNVEAHYRTTGPEIWEQTEHRVSHVIVGTGTGGTISGVGRFLKEKNSGIKMIGVEATGSMYHDYFKHGRRREPGPHLVEGIGNEEIAGIMDFDVVDDIMQIEDKEAFLMARRLLREEGVFAGGSSGAVVWAAIKVAENLGPDEILVAILADRGHNYLSKIFNDEWMKENIYEESKRKHQDAK